MTFQFLERNRLISGLASAVAIIEAPFQSGAINTAKHAFHQGKKVFSTPWALNYSKGAGGNNLFIYGATPLINYNQILNYIFPNANQISIEEFINDKVSLGTIFDKETQAKGLNVPEEYQAYFAYIKENSPVSLQEIINFFNKKCVADITADLTLMELDGYIKLVNDQYCL